MDVNSDFSYTNESFPILLIPKNSSFPSVGFDINKENLVDLNISTADRDGFRSDYYSGICIVKFFDENFEERTVRELSQIPETKDFSRADTRYAESSMYDDSAIGSCGGQSPSIIRDLGETVKVPVLDEASECTVMVHQYESFVSDDNICDYEEVIECSTINEADSKEESQAYEQQVLHNNGIDLNNLNLYEEDELECAELLCDLPEEVVIEESSGKKEDQWINNAQPWLKEVKYEKQSSALKQLLMSDKKPLHAENTIMFLSDDSQPGQTIHRIELQDPTLKCRGGAKVYYENSPNKKKYLCGNCNRFFDDMPSFKQHIDKNQKTKSNLVFFCTVCGKTLKSQQKIEVHTKRHGNPELECSICKNVYSSKFVLRNHLKKSHPNEHNENKEQDSYQDLFDFTVEPQKHDKEQSVILMCEKCDYFASSEMELQLHSKIHEPVSMVDAHFREPVTSTNYYSESEMSEDSSDCYLADIKKEKINSSSSSVEKANSDIAKVLSSKMFMCNAHVKGLKICNVCSKSFDRLSDLKRHLIEHIIKSSLVKTPTSSESTLNIRCVVCHAATFDSIARYKNHLRKHAKLTIYQCTVCNKSFSDSSNFCKHKKVHEANYLQCDICLRKFNTKLMIAKHMEHHNKTKPKPCVYCDKVFHFESNLNKHVKATHTKELIRFHCRFCEANFKSLKEKWDHEWYKHQVRKIVVDCLICGRKFRKFAELKRHSNEKHGITKLAKPKTMPKK